MNGKILYKRVYNQAMGRMVEEPRYYINGKLVSKEEWDRVFPDRPLGTGQGLIGWSQPIESVALGVTTKNIEKAREHDRRHGVPTDYTPEGSPIIRSAAHRRALLKLHRMHDNNSYL